EAPLPYPPAPGPAFPPQELDRIVSPIALYPDPLLGQILTAATFSPEIPAAAMWADQHHYVPPKRAGAAAVSAGARDDGVGHAVDRGDWRRVPGQPRIGDGRRPAHAAA